MLKETDLVDGLSPAANKYAAIEGVMRQYNYQEDGLIEVLSAAQEAYGYLSQDLLTYAADSLDLPLSKVYGVATFYDTFSLEPVAENECLICTGPVCSIHGAKDLLESVSGISAQDQSQEGRALVKGVSCLGLCDQGPSALINRQARVAIKPQDALTLLQGGGAEPRLLVDGEPRVLTGPIGRIHPTDLEAHRAQGAFAAIEKALTEMSPQEVIEQVKTSHLAGRGGAGFPTGLKLEFASKAADPERLVVCNFDESEPGTFKDRVLMEGNPFRVIEGLALSAYAIGAHKGYIYIRAEYPRATEILEEALGKLYDAHLLGDHILGTDFNFDIEIRHNAGAYICGEETALFESIEGKRGHPRLKPPYPTESGLFGKPTAINNVETLAVVPSLVLYGGDWFRQWGTPDSVGLKLFCLSGHVQKPGVVEVPMGLTVRELVDRYGGGFEGEPQAVLLGGAAGGFLRGDQLDVRLTHEDLRPLDVPIGSGALMVFNETVDIWQVLENVAHFFVHETCGHCAPCRLGTKQIYSLLQRINQGDGGAEDVQKLERLGGTIRRICACGLGMTAANPALTVLHNLESTP